MHAQVSDDANKLKGHKHGCNMVYNKMLDPRLFLFVPAHYCALIKSLFILRQPGFQKRSQAHGRLCDDQFVFPFHFVPKYELLCEKLELSIMVPKSWILAHMCSSCICSRQPDCWILLIPCSIERILYYTVDVRKSESTTTFLKSHNPYILRGRQQIYLHCTGFWMTIRQFRQMS